MSEISVMEQLKKDFQSGETKKTEKKTPPGVWKPPIPTSKSEAKKRYEAAGAKAGENVAFYINPDIMADAAGVAGSIDFGSFLTEISACEDWIVDNQEPPVFCSETVPWVDVTTLTIEEQQKYYQKLSQQGQFQSLSLTLNGVILQVTAKMNDLRECADKIKENQQILEKIVQYLSKTADAFSRFEKIASNKVNGIKL